MKTLIIGGAGFVGCHLIPRLLELNYDVTVMDIVPPTSAVKIQRWMGEIDYKWQSVLDISGHEIRHMDTIVHLAAVADVPFAMSSPTYALQQNVEGTLRLLEAIRKHCEPPQRLIYMSSESVYGHVPHERLPIVEGEPLRPVNVYGATKAAADILVQAYNRCYDLPTIVLRSGTMFGEQSRLKQAIPIFIRQALTGKDITLEGDGSQTRDFNYVGNVIDGIVKAIDARDSRLGEVFNLGSGVELSLHQIVDKILDFTQSESKITYKPWRGGEQGLRVALSIEKAKTLLKYRPAISFDEGLKKTIRWLEAL